MNLDVYKRELLNLRDALSARTRRDVATGRAQAFDYAADSGDVSVADESESEDFARAERESVTVDEIDAALRRIDDGTFGQCLVDGGPIEPKRLEAVPWAQYCLKHQTELEAGSRRAPTL